MTTLIENQSLFVRERQKLHQFPMDQMERFWKTLPDSDPENHPGCGYIPSGITCHSCGKKMGEPLPEPYCYQRDIIEDDHLTIEVAGGEQAGKHLHVDTPIPTVDGWKRMGDMRVGDLVFDENGEVVMVEWISPIQQQPSYRITFDNGDEIIASASHKWVVQNYNARKHGYAPKVRTTQEMFEQGDTRLAPNNRRPFANWSIRSPKPLELEPADLPLDPYVLGAWLGDGTSDSAIVTTTDEEVLTQLAWAGVDVRTRPSTPISYGMGGVALADGKHTAETNRASITRKLRLMGLLGNKHIPQTYLRSSTEQRWALLQGLMDTDGYIDKRGRMEFSNSNRTLIDGFVELLSSFGLSFRVREKRAMLNGRDCGPTWNVSFQTKACAFRLPRKAARQKPELHSSRSENIYINKIEPVGDQAVRCISVSSASHLYLAGRTMIPTHNTTSSAVKFTRVIIQFLGEYGPKGLAAGEVAWITAKIYGETAREFNITAGHLKRFFPKVRTSKGIAPGEIQIPVNGGFFTIITKSADDPQDLRAESPIAVLVCENARLSFDAYKRLMTRVGRSRANFPGFGAIIMSGTFETSLGWKMMLWQNWQSPSVQESQNVKSFSLPSFSNVFVYGPGVDENGVPYPGGEDHPELVRQKGEISETEYRERIQAIPAPPSGRVHYGFDPTIHLLDAEYDDAQPVLIGMDPGYSGQPSSYAVEAFQRRFTKTPTGQPCDNLHYSGIDEIRARQLPPEEIAREAMNRKWWRNDAKTAVIDVAGRQHAGAQESNTETWRRVTGLTLYSQPVRVMEGVRRMDSLLMKCPKCSEPYLTFSPKQKLLISELGGDTNPFDDQVHVYSWQTDRQGNVTGHTPMDWWCDGIKAATYLFMHLLGSTNTPRGGSKIRVRSKRERMGLVNAY